MIDNPGPFFNTSDMGSDEYDTFTALITSVVEHPGEHRITARRARDGQSRRLSVRIEFEDGHDPPIAQPFHHQLDLLQRWTGIGFLEWRYEDDDRAARFTDDALNWYRRTRRLSERDVERVIGMHLLEHAKSSKRTMQTTYAELAGVLGIQESRLTGALAVLKARKLITDHGPAVAVPFGGGGPMKTSPVRFIGFTEPAGINWAVDGFGLSTATHNEVNVTVNILLQQYIERVQEQPVEQELRDRFELAIRRLEQESEKDSPKLQTVRDVLDIMGMAKEFIPIGVSFLNRHMGTLERLTNSFPGL